MPIFNPVADCIRKTINNTSSADYFKFDANTFNSEKIIKNISITSPKLENLINHIQELDRNDFDKYGKNFKHIIYSDLRNSLAGIKLIASAFKAYGMSNIYDNRFNIIIPDNNNNFALLSSVAIYNKPFPIKLRNNILKLFNKRPDNIYGEQIRFLLIDQGFKEGIDVFDVKYVHIFDELITPADEKQAIGRGTRFCGQKGLNFNPELGWPLHVFKYRLLLTDKLKEKYETNDAFSLFLKESNIDIKKLYFAAELENICRFGAIDYEINKAIHEFGNEENDDLKQSNIIEKINNFQSFKLNDIYDPLENYNKDDFKLLKKAYNQFGGLKNTKFIIKKNNKNITKKKLISKKTSHFINIQKVKPIEKILIKKLDFINMRKYIRKYFNIYKWTNLKFENKCVDTSTVTKRIVDLNNSQLFVSNFFTNNSSYKGILFWHSVGTGKTCSAIATASNTFEKENYTILWVTRHTLKPDIWKNIYTQVCSNTIKEKLEKGINIPDIMTNNQLKYLDNKWVMPISYKQFSNLIAGKNKFYDDLVKKNGKQDPLKKTLIIIDEAHKIFANDVPINEKPNIKILKKAIYNSYKLSNENSCKLLLMTATPYTNDPIQLFKLLNLLKEDDYFPENFDEFKNEYLDDNYKFHKDKNKIFLDKITGYISYLNREKDIRQFAYPIIYIRDINMSNDNNEDLSFYKYFFDDIKDYINIDINIVKNIIKYFKLLIKNKKNKTEIISQEEAIEICISKNNNDKIKDVNIQNFILNITELIKEQEEKIKEEKKIEKQLEKQKEKEEKQLEKQKEKEEKQLLKQKEKEEKQLLKQKEKEEKQLLKQKEKEEKQLLKQKK